MRISDWSSDVCSSDLLAVRLRGRHCIAEEVLRVKRPDVMRHLGLPHDEYGFTARFRIAEVEGVEDVVGIRVLAGTRSGRADTPLRSEEHTSELQSLMRISYADFCLKRQTITNVKTNDYI